MNLSGAVSRSIQLRQLTATCGIFSSMHGARSLSLHHATTPRRFTPLHTSRKYHAIAHKLVIHKPHHSKGGGIFWKHYIDVAAPQPDKACNIERRFAPLLSSLSTNDVAELQNTLSYLNRNMSEEERAQNLKWVAQDIYLDEDADYNSNYMDVHGTQIINKFMVLVALVEPKPSQKASSADDESDDESGEEYDSLSDEEYESDEDRK